jgi:hypothetical protein
MLAPSLGDASNVSIKELEEADEELGAAGSSCETVPSNHFTAFNCAALTESKQIGHRAHLFSEVLR